MLALAPASPKVAFSPSMFVLLSLDFYGTINAKLFEKAIFTYTLLLLHIGPLDRHDDECLFQLSASTFPPAARWGWNGRGEEFVIHDQNKDTNARSLPWTFGVEIFLLCRFCCSLSHCSLLFPGEGVRVAVFAVVCYIPIASACNENGVKWNWSGLGR